MKLDVQISGLTNLRKRFDGLPEKSKKLVRDALMKAGYLVEGASKKEAPVGTPESTHRRGYTGGRMRASIKVSDSLLNRVNPAVVISPHTHYARYVHDGTRYMKARPFMTKGYESSKAKIRSIMKALLKDIKNSL